MRVHCLLHAQHEDTGCIEPWLVRRGHTVTLARLHAGARLPPLEAFDWLVVMGGPMNVDDHDRHPWLAAEKALIGEAIAADRRVLGICLGAQLIARALGAPVTPNPQLEIGWFEVHATPALARARTLRRFPPAFTAFHWHGDTFGLPAGARSLLASAACANQAFEVGARTCAVQFHLEVTAANAREWLAVDAPAPAPFVQDAAAILAGLDHFGANNRLMHVLLEALEQDSS